MSSNTGQTLADSTLKKLLNRNNTTSNNVSNSALWLGSQFGLRSRRQTNALDTGYPKLNQLLHGQGWPLHTSNEFGLSDFGIGELRLLLPGLRQLCKQHSQANILWIAPPFLPFAPALIKEQINVGKLSVVQTNSIDETLWATEQALLADCCAAVFSWTGKHNLSMRQLRRLQLATQKTKAWNVIFRHSDCLQQVSPSGLRLQLQSNACSQLEAHITKQPYGWAGQRCTLSMPPHYESWQRLPAHLWTHHNSFLHGLPLQSLSLQSLSLQSLPLQNLVHSNLPQLKQKKHKREVKNNSASVTLLSSVAALKSAS